MEDPDNIVASINGSIGNLKQGSLRMFGQWFGRPMDNIHTITNAWVEDEGVTIVFDQGELLRVVHPHGYEGSSEVFRISRASEVLWQWYSYGQPHLPQNIRELHF